MIAVVEGLSAGLFFVAGGAQAAGGHVGLERSRGDTADPAQLVGSQPDALGRGGGFLQGVQAAVDRPQLAQELFPEVEGGHFK